MDGVLVSSSSGNSNQVTCSLGTVRVCAFEKEPGRLPLTQLARQYDTEKDPKGRPYIGAYTVEQRQARVKRFMELRRRRVWFKKVKYACRRRLASARLRYKGRFVRSIEDIPPEERHLYVDALKGADKGSRSRGGGSSKRNSGSSSSAGGAGAGAGGQQYHGVYRLAAAANQMGGGASAYGGGASKTTRSGRASRAARHG